MPAPRGLPPDRELEAPPTPPPKRESVHLQNSLTTSARAPAAHRKSDTSTSSRPPSATHRPHNNGKHTTARPPSPSALGHPTTLDTTKHVAPSIAVTTRSTAYFPRQSQLSGYSTEPSVYSGTDWGVGPGMLDESTIDIRVKEVMVDGSVIDMRLKHSSQVTGRSTIESSGVTVRRSSSSARPSSRPRESGTISKSLRTPRLSPQEGIRTRDSLGSSRTQVTITPPSPTTSLTNDAARPPTPPPKPPSLRPRGSTRTLGRQTTSTLAATPAPPPPPPYGPGPVAYLHIECLLPEYACSHPAPYSSPRVVDLTGTVNWISPHKVTRSTASVDAVWRSLRNLVAVLHAEAATLAEYTPPSSSRPGQGYPASRRVTKAPPWACLVSALDNSPRIAPSRAPLLREKVSSKLYKAASKYTQSTTSLEVRDIPKPTTEVQLRNSTGTIAVPISAPINLPNSLLAPENKRNAIYLPGPSIPMPRVRHAPPAPEPSPRIDKKQWSAIRATLAVFDAHCAVAAGLDAQMTDINNGNLPFHPEMAVDPAIDLVVHIALVRLLCSCLLESYAATEFNRRTGRRVRSLVRHVVAVCHEFGGRYVYIERVRSRTLAELKENGVELRPVGRPSADHIVLMAVATPKPPTIRFASDTATTSIKSVETPTTARSVSAPRILKTAGTASRTASMLSKLSRRPRLPEGWGATPKSAAPVPPPKP